MWGRVRFCSSLMAVARMPSRALQQILRCGDQVRVRVSAQLHGSSLPHRERALHLPMGVRGSHSSGTQSLKC